VERRDSGESMAIWAPEPGLLAYHAGVTAICELAARFPAGLWDAPAPCPDWCAADVAGHLLCVADDYHEYLDEAPASRMARLMATGADARSLARKFARQNAAELAALPDGSAPDRIRAFAATARAYARRAVPLWDLPHHHYRGTVVTVGGMVGAACAEWHLHAWDLAWVLGQDYCPADPDLLVAGWLAGVPQLPLDPPAGRPSWSADPVSASRPAAHAPLSGTVRLRPGAVGRGGCAVATDEPGSGHGSVIAGTAGRAAVAVGQAGWLAMLRASGRPVAQRSPA
jgi:hypothetical protein